MPGFRGKHSAARSGLCENGAGNAPKALLSLPFLRAGPWRAWVPPPQLSPTVTLACTTVRNDSVVKCDAGKSLQGDWFSLRVEKREVRDFQCYVHDTDKLTSLVSTWCQNLKIYKRPFMDFSKAFYLASMVSLEVLKFESHTHTPTHIYTNILLFLLPVMYSSKSCVINLNKNHGGGHCNIVDINGTLQGTLWNY